MSNKEAIDGEIDDPDGSDDVWTEFETEKESCGTLSADGNPLWGAYCPQPDCGELNLYEGDPSAFTNRPYRCRSCNWVSLMHKSAADIEAKLPDPDEVRG